MSRVNQSSLVRLEFFRAANSALQAEMCLTSEHRLFPAGKILYREGDRADAVALIVRGDVRVFKTSDTGSEITLYHVYDGQPCLMNLLSVVLCRAAMASAVSETPTEALLFPVSAFRRWIETDNSVRTFVLETLANRTAEVMKLVEELAFQKVDHRLAHVLVERFYNHGIPLRVLHATRDELARELGTAREVVSRLLKVLERRGVGRSHIELVDECALSQLVADNDGPYPRKVAVV